MRAFRDVDATQKWMNTAISENMLVPAFAAAIVGEIEAQATHMAELENTISTKSEKIRGLELAVKGLETAVDERDAKIARMREVVESLGLKARVVRLLKEEF